MSTSEGARLVSREFTKRFGRVNAVQELSFSVEPGQVTGFLGPNGAGKTTTLRAALGLLEPTTGEITINGTPYRALRNPARMVGAVLDPNRGYRASTGLSHLRICTAAMGIPDRRAGEVLERVGLAAVARRRADRYSLGMRQRLALATALLGEPQLLVLDEPGGGLDPEGVAWLRGLLRGFADAGGTVLVSSHQLAELAQLADRVVIISRGRGVYEGPLNQSRAVRVRSADPARLAARLGGMAGVEVRPDEGSWLVVQGCSADHVGEVAHAAGVAVHELHYERDDLERRFLALTSTEYQPAEQLEAAK